MTQKKSVAFEMGTYEVQASIIGTGTDTAPNLATFSTKKRYKIKKIKSKEVLLSPPENVPCP